MLTNSVHVLAFLLVSYSGKPEACKCKTMEYFCPIPLATSGDLRGVATDLVWFESFYVRVSAMTAINRRSTHCHKTSTDIKKMMHHVTHRPVNCRATKSKHHKTS